MSLTSFIKIPQVSAVFRREFKLAPMKLEGELRAPPVTANYALIGTAFDYLMRFYLERTNKNAVADHWVAENSVLILNALSKMAKGGKKSDDIEELDLLPAKWQTLLESKEATSEILEASEKMTSLLMDAKKSHAAYLSKGKMDDDIIRTSIVLAQMDGYYRSGMISPKLGSVEDGDITDLRNLISLVDRDAFKSRDLCLLNPTFGYGSTLVGGADADLIIDDTLIDIKTTKYLSFTQEHYNQLIGYYILSKLGRLNDSLDVPISKIGIYFSRHGVLHTISSREIENNPNFPKFVRWFEKSAKMVFGEE